MNHKWFVSQPQNYQIKNNFTFILSCFAYVCLVGCATGLTRYDQLSEGEWTAKSLVKDLVEKKSFIVNIDLVSIKPDKLRMEITTPSGFAVASVVMSGNKIKYAVAQRQEYYQGAANENSFKPIFPLALNPQVLPYLLFDEVPPIKGWSCTTDKKGMLKDCVDKVSGVKFIVSDRELHRKNFIFESEKGSLQMNLQGFKPKVESADVKFELAAPAGYKKFLIK